MTQLLQNLRRHPLASILNLLGLSAALAACYILATQVQFAKEYNLSLDGYEKAYRVEVYGVLGEKPMAYISRPAMEKIKKLPQVEGVAIVSKGGASTLWKNGEEFVHLTGWMLNPEGLKVLGARMICGKDSLTARNEVMLSASYARKIFGTEMAVGKHFETTSGELTVAGVIQDFGENCMIPNVMFLSLGDQYMNDDNMWNLVGYVRLRDGVDAANAEKLIKDAAFAMPSYSGEEHRQDYLGATKNWDLKIRPVSETYFSGIDPSDKGSASMLLLLQAACWLILIVAAINFANFTLAETPMRIKGVNTRKVLGMTNWQLRRGMILETVAVAVVAFGLSLVMVYLLSLAPWMMEMLNGSISLADNLHLIIYIGAAALAVGVLVGIYPAWFATSFPPAMVLKGSFGLSPRGVFLRKSLVFVQLFVAFLLTFYIGVLFLQKNYIFTSDYGFDKDEIVFCNYVATPDKFDAYRTQLEAIPGVESVGFCSHLPGVDDLIMKWGRRHGSDEMTQTVIEADENLLPTLGIEIVEGRNFSASDEDRVIVNETTRRLYDWIEIDKPMSDEGVPVVGICQNFRIHSARIDDSSEPLAFLIISKTGQAWRSNPYKIVVRIGANVDKIAVKKKLDETLAANFPAGYPIPEFRFFDDQLQTTYEEEFRFIRQVEGFSLVCLLVTLVGVFCLTIFETQYRRREIALRRVLGSRSADIHRLFLLRHLALILPAFLLAAPAAWRLSADWLQNFSDRTPIPLWLPFITFLSVTLPILLTVAAQTWRVLRMKPVEVIKGE